MNNRDLIASLENLGNTDIIFKVMTVNERTIGEYSEKYSEIRGYERVGDRYLFKPDYKLYKILPEKFGRYDIVLNGHDHERLLICVNNNPRDIERQMLQDNVQVSTTPNIATEFVDYFHLECGQTGKRLLLPLRVMRVKSNQYC